MGKDLSGETIKGYELRDAIGAGGFGQVYRAYQALIKRDVAIKIILPEFANHPDFIRRFEFEAQLVARLEHIHIVPLYDYWREPDGAYLVMRWLRGGSLRSQLKGGSLPLDRVALMLDQIAAALSAAHRRGIIHRDIKPDNILFDEDGNAYLADFGIAKDLRDSSYDLGGEEGSLTGSPFYISPEQVEDKPVSPQTDIYSLGILLYEVLAGKPPFTSEEGLIDILMKQVHEPMPSLLDSCPDLPRALDEVIQRATAKKPDARYADVLVMASSFRKAIRLSQEAPSPHPIKPGIVEVDDEILIFTKPLTSLAGITINIVDAAVDNPYKGLHAFQEADASDFFGREALIQQLLTRVGEPSALARFLAVIGPSGSGKSSVVKAGVIPALRRGELPRSERWFLAEMVPGGDPFRELETALLSVAVDAPEGLSESLRRDDRGLLNAVTKVLPGDDSELVLTIDQFEEVFTQVDDEAERLHFLNSLLVAVTDPRSRLRVIITLRADFYDRPLLYPGFGELLRKRNEVVMPLSPDEMKRAIVGPAERAGLTVEPGLLAAIVTEISEQPGALPLLQYTLTEIFERRQDNRLTLEAYQASGGVLGALARRAEELYLAMEPDTQQAMRQIFLRLVTLSEGAEDTRRRALHHELTAVVENERTAEEVISTLGKYRLLTFDHDPVTRAPTVEVAHEALIREWERLQEWLNENREDILLQRRLSSAADEWNRVEHNPSFLTSGLRLSQFEGLLERGNIALTLGEQEYIRASVAARVAQEAAEAARVAREEALERRSRQRLKALATVFMAAAVVTSILAVIALLSFKTARNQRAAARSAQSVAERNADVSHSLALVASSQLELQNHNTDEAIDLAIQANQIPNPPMAALQMLAAAAQAPGTRRVLSGHEDIISSAVFTPDGQRALSGSWDQTLILWDLQTGAILQRFEGHTDRVRSVAISADGSQAISGGRDGAIILWDLTNGQEINRMQLDADHTAYTVAVSPNGQQVLVGANDGLLILWNVETGDQQSCFEGHMDTITSVAFSPDGQTAISGSYDESIIWWDLATCAIKQKIEGTHSGGVATVQFTPDGLNVVSGGGDQMVKLWSLETGEETQTFKGHGSWIESVDVSRDGQFVLSSSDDGSIRVWDINTGDEISRLIGHDGVVRQAVFNASGTQVLSASEDMTLRLWDLRNGAEIRRFSGHTDIPITVVLNADGTQVLTTSMDGTVRLWDYASGTELGQFAHDGAPMVAIFAPDGKTFISAAVNTVYEWDIQSQSIIHTMEGHSDEVEALTLSPDGKTIFSAGLDAVIIAWDRAEGTELYRLEGHENYIWAVTISPDGKTALSSSDDGDIILWVLETHQPVRHYAGHSGGVTNVAFSPDGLTAISSSRDTMMMLWDVATGSMLRQYTGHTGSVTTALFSPDGKTILSASEDGTLRTWDVATGTMIRRLENGSAVWDAVWGPDGKTAFSVSPDITVREWEAAPLTLDGLLTWTHANRYVAAPDQ